MDRDGPGVCGSSSHRPAHKRGLAGSGPVDSETQRMSLQRSRAGADRPKSWSTRRTTVGRASARMNQKARGTKCRTRARAPRMYRSTKTVSRRSSRFTPACARMDRTSSLSRTRLATGHHAPRVRGCEDGPSMLYAMQRERERPGNRSRVSADEPGTRRPELLHLGVVVPACRVCAEARNSHQQELNCSSGHTGAGTRCSARFAALACREHGLQPRVSVLLQRLPRLARVIMCVLFEGA